MKLLDQKSTKTIISKKIPCISYIISGIFGKLLKPYKQKVKKKFVIVSENLHWVF